LIIENLSKIVNDRLEKHRFGQSHIESLQARIKELNRIRDFNWYSEEDKDTLIFERGIYLQTKYNIYNDRGNTKFKIKK